MKLNPKKGFTLVELVMAVVIAAIAVYTLIAIFMHAASSSVSLDEISTALYLADGKLESVSSRSYASISSESSMAFSGSFSDFSSLVVVHGVASTELDTSVDPLSTGYKKITVYVSGSSLPGSVEISTLVTDTSN